MEKEIQVTGKKVTVLYIGILMCGVGVVGAIFRDRLPLSSWWFIIIFLCGFVMIWLAVVAQERSDIGKLHNLVLQQNTVVALFSGIVSGNVGITSRPFSFYLKSSDQILFGKLREKHTGLVGNPLPLYHYDIYQGKKKYYTLAIHSYDQYAEIVTENNNRIAGIQILDQVLDVSLADEKFQVRFQDETITITKNNDRIATGRAADNMIEFHFDAKMRMTKEQMLLLPILSIFFHL